MAAFVIRSYLLDITHARRTHARTHTIPCPLELESSRYFIIRLKLSFAQGILTQGARYIIVTKNSSCRSVISNFYKINNCEGTAQL
jgi:hypothetical protein